MRWLGGLSANIASVRLFAGSWGDLLATTYVTRGNLVELHLPEVLNELWQQIQPKTPI